MLNYRGYTQEIKEITSHYKDQILQNMIAVNVIQIIYQTNMLSQYRHIFIHYPDSRMFLLISRRISLLMCQPYEHLVTFVFGVADTCLLLKLIRIQRYL